MRFSPFIRTAAAFPVLALAAAPAFSQSIHGELGAQSRSSIRISVSVMPRFNANTSSMISSNAPALRYSLVRFPARGPIPAPSAPGEVGKESDASADQVPLVLVVPD